MASGRVEIDEGGAARLHLDSPVYFKKALAHFRGRVKVTLEPEIERRRARANRYYWGVVLKMMAEETGHTPDQIHEFMKIRHNSSKATITDPLTGEEVLLPQSTAKLSIADFSVYLERVMLFAAEWLGIVFPDPTPAEDWRISERSA